MLRFTKHDEKLVGHWTSEAEGPYWEATVQASNGARRRFDCTEAKVVAQCHQHGVRRDTFALDHIVRDDKHRMTAGPQDVPDLDENLFEVGEKGPESSGKCAVVEDRSREQAADPWMRQQPGVEVELTGMAEPNILATAR